MAITKLTTSWQKITVSGTSENEIDFSKYGGAGSEVFTVSIVE